MRHFGSEVKALVLRVATAVTGFKVQEEGAKVWIVGLRFLRYKNQKGSKKEIQRKSVCVEMWMRGKQSQRCS